MKWMNNQKGSTLMMVVITVAILSILGTALLSMSLMNVNMKASDYNVKKSQYYAESGIDQVYARTNRLVEDAITYSIVMTNTEIEDLLEKIDRWSKAADRTSEVDYDSTLWDKYTIPMGTGFTIDTKELADKAEGYYKEQFRDYLDGENNDTNMSNNDIVKYLKLSDLVYLDENKPSNNSLLSVEVKGPIVSFSGAGSDMIIKNVTSTFKLQDRTEKIIVTDIVISDDISNYPLTTVEKRFVVPNNPLWQKALVAEGNIILDSTNVTVEGETYSYAAVGNVDDLTAKEGIVISNATKATFKGNVFSRGTVQLEENSNSSTRLDVDNSVVYANNLVLQKGSSGTIEVNGNVYTSDDLELNGDGGKLTINGSYYGYTDGSSSGAHSKSSAIVINADMKENNSAVLRITGNPASGIDRVESESGILIGGTAYINTSIKYQTAESVSIKGNYTAYTLGFVDTTIQAVIADGFLSSQVNSLFPYYGSGTVYEDTMWDMFFEDNINKEPIVSGSTINFITGYDANKNNLIDPGEDYSIGDRKAYFALFDKYVDSGYLNRGKEADGDRNVFLDNYIYTTGLKLDGSNNFRDALSLSGGVATNINKIDENDFGKLIKRINEDVIYQFNMMDYRNGGLAAILVPGETVTEVPVEGKDKVNAIYKYSILDTGSGNIPGSTVDFKDVTKYDKVGTANEIFFVDYSTATPLNIYGDNYGGAKTGTYIDIGQDVSGQVNAQGIIVSGSDINIYGDINFYGAIISNGTITTHSGDQTFTNDDKIKEYLAEKIYENDALYEFFNVSRFGDLSTNVVTIPGDVEVVKIDKPTKSFDDKSNSIYEASNLVRFEQWKVVQ